MFQETRNVNKTEHYFLYIKIKGTLYATLV